MSTITGNTVPPARAEQVASLQTMISGLTKHEASISSLLIQGKSYPVSGLVTVLQARLAAANAVVTTRASWQNAVKSDKTARIDTNEFVAGLRQALLVAFAGQVDTLADFGLVGRKPRVVSPEAKVIAAQKAKATRAARHTMGKNQKAALKGDVATVTLTAGASSTTVTAEPAATAAAPSSLSPSPSATTTNSAPKQA